MRPARFDLYVEMVRAGHNRQTLGAAIGRTGQYVSAVLNGYAAPDTRDIEKMSKALDIPKERWVEVFFLPNGEPPKEKIPEMRRTGRRAGAQGNGRTGTCPREDGGSLA